MLIQALESIGDNYGIYGFSGYGRENVEFYVIKDIGENFGERIKRRIDKITPLHATRMGSAIRHAITKLENQDSPTKIMFLISDGRPQDRGYSREGVEKEYAVHDTHMALMEGQAEGYYTLLPDRGQGRPRLPQGDVRGYGLRSAGRNLGLAGAAAHALPPAYRLAWRDYLTGSANRRGGFETRPYTFRQITLLCLGYSSRSPLQSACAARSGRYWIPAA